MQQLEGQTARPGLGLHPAAERMNLRTLHSWCWATALCSLLLGQRACPAQQAAVHCPVLRSRQYPPGAPSPRHMQRHRRPSHAPNTQSPTKVLHTGPTWREMPVGFLQVNRPVALLLLYLDALAFLHASSSAGLQVADPCAPARSSSAAAPGKQIALCVGMAIYLASDTVKPVMLSQA